MKPLKGRGKDGHHSAAHKCIVNAAAAAGVSRGKPAVEGRRSELQADSSGRRCTYHVVRAEVQHLKTDRLSMRLCRFDDNRLGIVDGESVRDVTAALDVPSAGAVPAAEARPAHRSSATGARACAIARDDHGGAADGGTYVFESSGEPRQARRRACQLPTRTSTRCARTRRCTRTTRRTP
jgi:hypothetical protein